MKYVAWLWRGTKDVRVNIVTRILAGIGRVACGLLMIWLSKRFIDETIRTGTQDDILQMILFLVLTVVGTIVLRLLYYYMTAAATVKKTNALRLFYFGTLFRRKLFDGHELHSGDVSSRLSKDIETVSTSIIDTIPQMAVTGIQLVGAFLLMRWFDARLAWALLLLTPVLVVVGKLISRRLRNMTLEIREGESRIQMQVQEGVEYNAVLRSLESENWVLERLGLKQSKLENDVMRRTRFTAVARFAIGSAFGLGYLLAFIWGGLGLREGTITFGVMTSFLQLVGQIQHPILTLLGMVPQLVHSTASIDRLDELEKGADETPGESRAESLSGMREEMLLESPLEMRGRLGLRLDNVSFGYKGGDREVVCGFSHDFKPGSKNAIMGETGKGKTTLFRLLLGFFLGRGLRVIADGSHHVLVDADNVVVHLRGIVLVVLAVTDVEMIALLHELSVRENLDFIVFTVDELLADDGYSVAVQILIRHIHLNTPQCRSASRRAPCSCRGTAPRRR